MNDIPAGLVLPGMRIHRQNALPSASTGRQGRPTDTPARRRRWRSRRGRDRGNAWPGPDTATVRGQTAAVQIMAGEITLGEPPAVQTAPGELAAVQTASGETVADAVQLAIGLLTASLDSLGLESWAVEALTPHDADGMANFMAGLHVVSELLLRELCEATGEPPEAILQRLAFLAERWRRTSSAG
jgi:hypothetical protein